MLAVPEFLREQAPYISIPREEIGDSFPTVGWNVFDDLFFLPSRDRAVAQDVKHHPSYLVVPQ